MQQDQKEGESSVTRSMMEELHSWDIEQGQMEGESGVARSIVDELHSSDIQEDQMQERVVLFEVSLMNFILRISKEMKWRGK